MVDVTTITVAQFQAQFPNDFQNVEPAQIAAAFAEAQIMFNPALFSSAAQQTVYLYLTAHFLALSVRASYNGVNSAGSFPVSSRSVGGVSESYMIPDMYKENAAIAQYTSTAYGQKYLTFLLPNLVGNVASVWGGTNA